MTVAGQTQVTYTYDNANRLTQVQQGTSTVGIGYDIAGRRTSLTLPNTNSLTYAYNAASELTSVTYKQGTTTLGNLTYTYEAAGNRLITGGTFARTNLPPALASASYNANNQQTAFGTTTETYDLNGNLATVTDAGGTTTYTWNARNELTGISRTGLTASFTYDSFGRRTGKIINGTTTNFLYDGLNPVQEKNGGTVTANLLTGLGIDEFFTRTDSVGARALLPDALGSTVALGDNTGGLQTQYTYKPFGVTTQIGAASTSSYKFTGREDDETGLYYYRARYYQPQLQRFIAEDPIGYLSGDVNVYGYTMNNPVRFIDPFGLFMNDLPMPGPASGALQIGTGALGVGTGVAHSVAASNLWAIGTAAGSGFSHVGHVGHALVGAGFSTMFGVALAGGGGYLIGQGFVTIVPSAGTIGGNFIYNVNNPHRMINPQPQKNDPKNNPKKK